MRTWGENLARHRSLVTGRCPLPRAWRSKYPVGFEDFGGTTAAGEIVKGFLFLARFFQSAVDDFNFQFPRHHKDAVDVSKNDVTRPHLNALNVERNVVGDHLPSPALILSITAIAEHREVEGQN